jgi:hypothetical protein
LASLIKGSESFVRVHPDSGALICDDLEAFIGQLKPVAHGLFYSKKTGKTYSIEVIEDGQQSNGCG